MEPDISPTSKAIGITAATIVNAAELTTYQNGSIVRRELVKKPTGAVTIFAFDEGQGLKEHTAPFDALVHVLDGEAEIRIAGKPYSLHGGDMILIPAHQPHALTALKRFRMMLTLVRS